MEEERKAAPKKKEKKPIVSPREWDHDSVGAFHNPSMARSRLLRFSLCPFTLHRRPARHGSRLGLNALRSRAEPRMSARLPARLPLSLPEVRNCAFRDSDMVPLGVRESRYLVRSMAYSPLGPARPGG